MAVRRCDPAKALETLAEELYTSVSELRSPSRKKTVLNSRAVCMWVLKQVGLSSVEVGDIMHRDHSTVLAAWRKVDARRRDHAGWKLITDSAAKRVLGKDWEETND